MKGRKYGRGQAFRMPPPPFLAERTTRVPFKSRIKSLGVGGDGDALVLVERGCKDNARYEGVGDGARAGGELGFRARLGDV